MGAGTQTILERAASLSGRERVAFLDEACGSNAELRFEIESLLAFYSTSSDLLDRLATTIRGGSPVRRTGQTVAQFEIGDEIGRGGMGIVYRARDLRLGREVALKFLSAHLLQNEDAKARFEREAQVVSRLRHPNICSVHDVGETKEGWFLVMPLYEGGTLKEEIAGGPLGPERATAILRQVASGLEKAHAAGVVHRDIKPSNIMLEGDHAVLMDFGIVKLNDSSHTQTTATLGTLAYMSPEQVRGEPAGPRSDLWSLGVLAFEMLTGHLPFQGPHAEAQMHALLTEDVPEFGSGDPVLDSIVRQLLQKKPEDRFESASDLLAMLDGDTATRPVPRTLMRLGRGFLLTGLTAAVVVLVAVLSLVTRPEASPPRRPSVAVLPFDDLSGDEAVAYVSDGITEELINLLVGVRGMRVPGRTSSFYYKGRDAELSEIASRLGVEHVVDGSVRWEGERIRVAAQLVNGETGSAVWSRVYDRDARDVFGLQEEIARSIVDTLSVILVGAESAVRDRPEPVGAAYDLYMKARFFFHRRTPEDVLKAIEYFNKALEVDSSLVGANAGLVHAYSSLAAVGIVRFEDIERNMAFAARRAMEADSTSSGALNALGWYNLLSWDWPAAEAAFERAIDAQPGDASAHQWYGIVLLGQGRFAESVAARERAVELDPLSAVLHKSLADSYRLAGRLTDAVQQYREAIELEPRYWMGYQGLAHTLFAMGRPDSALIFQRHAVAHSGGIAEARGILAYFLGKTGAQREARAILEDLLGAPADNPMAIAVAHVGVGDVSAALVWLERAVEARYVPITFLRGQVAFQELGEDPWYQQLLSRIGAEG